MRSLVLKLIRLFSCVVANCLFIFVSNYVLAGPVGLQDPRSYDNLDLVRKCKTEKGESSFISIYECMNQDQKNQIQALKPVNIPDEDKARFWPKSEVYQRVEASPEEAFAIYSDYARYSDFVYKIAKSVPISPSPSQDPSIVEVDFQISMPPIPGLSSLMSPDFRTENRIFYLGEKQGFLAVSKKVTAASIEDFSGAAWFEPIPKANDGSGGGTLIATFNITIPISNSWFSNRLLKSDLIVSQIKSSGEQILQSVVDRIELERKDQNNPNSPLFGLLPQQINKLKTTLEY
jgi:hypothetical protein